MRDCSRRGDIILDTFLGSGTPFMAAERTGRRGFGMEIDSLYVDVAIRRYQRPRQTGCQLRVKTRHAHRSNQLCHSITPSARPSNDGGTVRPWAFAIFRFIKRSNVTGCCTGRSPRAVKHISNIGGIGEQTAVNHIGQRLIELCLVTSDPERVPGSSKFHLQR